MRNFWCGMASQNAEFIAKQKRKPPGYLAEFVVEKDTATSDDVTLAPTPLSILPPAFMPKNGAFRTMLKELKPQAATATATKKKDNEAQDSDDDVVEVVEEQDVWVKLAFSELKTGKYKCKIAQSVKGAHKREVKCAEGISSNPHHHMRRHHPKNTRQ